MPTPIQTKEGYWVLEGDSHLTQWITQRGRLDVDDTANEVARQYLKPGNVVVDAGAAVGDHTIAYLNAVGPTGRVHAFEPYLPAYTCLVKNCPKAECYNIALGADESGSVIHVDNEPNYGMAWVEPKPDGGCLVKPLTKFKFDQLDFIKIDVEGMEPEVITGAAFYLNVFRPVLYVELNHAALARRNYTVAQLVDQIEKHGYRHKFLSDTHSFDLPMVDVIFEPL